MIKAEDIKKTVDIFLQERDIFVVDIKVRPGNNITVLLDSDTGIKIEDCAGVTRYIESQFDRETEDYSLTVSSAGIGQPLKLLRQYLKIIGKEVEVELLDKTLIKGILQAADDNKIIIKTVSKVKKEVIEKVQELSYSEIKSVREVIKF